ncbi:MAG: fibronectin type III domain-containing protein [Candidatus Bathyarchaeia archaeon]
MIAMGERKNAIGEVVFLSVLLLLLLCSSVFPLNMASAAATLSLGRSGRTQTTITLSWSKSSDLVFSKYELFFSSNGVNGPFQLVWSTGDKSVTTYAVRNLSPATDYWFYIKDSDWFGSANSNTYQVSTTFNPSLSITVQTATTVSLSWSDSNIYSTLVPFKSYTIQMSTVGPDGPYSILETLTDRTQNTYTVTGLGTGLYYLQMYNTMGDGSISYSNRVNVSIVYVSINPNVPTKMELGQQVQFSASATGGSGSYNYQWRSNGSDITGAQSASFVFNPADPTDLGEHVIDVVVQDALYPNVRANSVPVPVTVTPKPLTLDISSSGTSMQIGEETTFTASATGGTGAYKFGWFVNGVQAGTTTSTFVLSPTQAGNYDVYATVEDTKDSSVVSASSRHISISVTNPPTLQPTATPSASQVMTQSNTAAPTSSNPQTQSQNLPNVVQIPISYIVMAVIIIAIVVGAVGIAVAARKRKIASRL